MRPSAMPLLLALVACATTQPGRNDVLLCNAVDLSFREPREADGGYGAPEVVAVNGESDYFECPAAVDTEDTPERPRVRMGRAWIAWARRTGEWDASFPPIGYRALSSELRGAGGSATRETRYRAIFQACENWHARAACEDPEGAAPVRLRKRRW